MAAAAVLILHAETGRSYSVVLAADASIGSLQSVLDPATAVPIKEQILLLDGMQMEHDRVLGEYQGDQLQR